MKTLTITNAEATRLADILRAVLLSKEPEKVVYATSGRDVRANLTRDAASVLDAIEHAAPAAPRVSGRHRWPRHGNVCELCGTARTRILEKTVREGREGAPVVRTVYVDRAGRSYRTFPCPGGPA